MTLRFCCALIGLSALLAMQFALSQGNYAEHFQSISAGMPREILLWSMAGMLCGGLLFRLEKYAGHMALCISAGVLVCISMARLDAGPALWGMAFWGNGMLLPPLLQLLLRESTRPGLHLGIALGAASCFWNFLLALPAPASPGLMSSLLLILQALAGSAFLLARSENSNTEEASTPPLTLARKVLPLLCATAVLFFPLSLLVNLPYRTTGEPHVSKVLSLYIWMLYPLAGLVLDRQGAHTRLILLCLGATVLAALCGQALPGSAGHWLAEILARSGGMGGFLFLFFLFSLARRDAPSYGGVVALPYAVLLGAQWVTTRAGTELPTGSYFALLIIFLALLLLYCCARLQTALDCAQDEHTEAEDTRRLVRAQCSTESFPTFAQKYNISVREQDVLRLIVDGLDTTAIGLALHLSEHTIKSHVRQLLRKTRTRNRITLAALFFNETGGRVEETQNALEPIPHRG